MTPPRRPVGAGPPEAVLFAGPILGGHAGRVASPAEVVAQRLETEGIETFLTSRNANPVARGAEMVRDIRRFGRRVDRVVVLVYSGRSFHYADLASRTCRRSGIRPHFWLHGGGLPALAKSRTSRVRRVLARGGDCIVPSDFLRRELEPVVRATTLIPNHVDTEFFSFRERRRPRPRLLWMRSFVAHCRPQLAVRTLAELSQLHPDATLTMAGSDQGELGSTQRLAERLGLLSRIRFVGFVSGTEKLTELDRHDVYLHTNEIDNAPISLLEAAACGLPVVGCRVGGVADLLTPDMQCLLVRHSEPAELSTAIDGLLGDPDSALRLAREARKVAEASAWARIRPLWISALSRPTEPPRTTEPSETNEAPAAVPRK